MNLYISGISGTGMGPLALMAKAAGFNVCGSDLAKGAIYDELVKAGIEVYIGKQDGKYLREKLNNMDWFCYTSALPETHPELMMAREAGIKCTKRDDLTAYLVSKLGLRMVAVAGTHGKTTTTAMIIWASLKLGIPISYIVGTTLGFAKSGAYNNGDKYFVYEADEYDRNFLKYYPWLAVVPYVSYDHPDIYPTRADYEEAFAQFELQSEKIIWAIDAEIKWKNTVKPLFEAEDFHLAGEARRIDAALAANAIVEILAELGVNVVREEIIDALDKFPGVGRRFERIADGAYSDYAHHPEEVKATIEMACEQAEIDNRKGVVVIYEPHQNTRQYEVRNEYREAFVGADKIFWLPTYLTRENPDLPVLKPEELTSGLVNEDIVEIAEPSRSLERRIKNYINDGFLVLLMTAGPADGWFRKIFGVSK